LQAYLWETVHALAAYRRRRDALARTARRLQGRPAVPDQARDGVLDAIEAAHNELGDRLSARPPRWSSTHRWWSTPLPMANHDAWPPATGWLLNQQRSRWLLPGTSRSKWCQDFEPLQTAPIILSRKQSSPRPLQTALLTADARIERSGAPFTCEIITVAPPQ